MASATGSADAIAHGTAKLCEVARQEKVRLVHMSTQSVYGLFEGRVHESMPMDPRLGWYGQAKCAAEMQVRDFVRRGGRAVVVRLWAQQLRLDAVRWLQGDMRRASPMACAP